MNTPRQAYDVLTRAVDLLDVVQEQAVEVSEKVHELVDEVAAVVLASATDASERIKQHLEDHPLQDPVVPPTSSANNVFTGPWGQSTDGVKNSSGVSTREEKIAFILEYAQNDPVLSAQTPSPEVLESMPDTLVEPLYQMVRFLNNRKK